MERSRRGEKGKKTLFVAVFIAILVGVVSTAGCGAILYRKGVSAGRDEVHEQSEEAVREIAAIVQEKDELERALNQLGEAESLAEYQEKLNEAREKTGDEASRTVLEELISEVKEMEKTDEADAVARSYEFGKLREEVKEAEGALNRRFKARLEGEVEKVSKF